MNWKRSARQFNHMAAKLQGSYATLERKVEERTHQLQAANLAKSRFLAAASHDLRQPLHALNLFVAQLRSETDQAERDRLAVRIEAAVANMNELFNALLDISKLDAGAMTPSVSEFPVGRILNRIEATFAAAAREKGLRLARGCEQRLDPQRCHPARADPAQSRLQRRALHVGWRRRRRLPAPGDALRIEVCDSGIGIAADQQRSIFSEFYQVAAPENGTARTDWGWGWRSWNAWAPCWSTPSASARRSARARASSHGAAGAGASWSCDRRAASGAAAADPLRGKLIVVIDDDALVLEGTGGLLRNWGCRVRHCPVGSRGAGETRRHRAGPDHFRLSPARWTDRHRRHRRDFGNAFGGPIPAFLVSGDISPERLRETQATGHHLLHKPVNPMTLRAIMSRLLKTDARQGGEMPASRA